MSFLRHCAPTTTLDPHLRQHGAAATASTNQSGVCSWPAVRGKALPGARHDLDRLQHTCPRRPDRLPLPPPATTYPSPLPPPPKNTPSSSAPHLRVTPSAPPPPGFLLAMVQVSTRSAAVLVALFEDSAGLVRVLLTQRSSKLTSHRCDNTLTASLPTHVVLCLACL